MTRLVALREARPRLVTVTLRVAAIGLVSARRAAALSLIDTSLDESREKLNEAVPIVRVRPLIRAVSRSRPAHGTFAPRNTVRQRSLAETRPARDGVRRLATLARFGATTASAGRRTGGITGGGGGGGGGVEPPGAGAAVILTSTSPAPVPTWRPPMTASM